MDPISLTASLAVLLRQQPSLASIQCLHRIATDACFSEALLHQTAVTFPLAAVGNGVALPWRLPWGCPWLAVTSLAMAFHGHFLGLPRHGRGLARHAVWCAVGSVPWVAIGIGAGWHRRGLRVPSVACRGLPYASARVGIGAGCRGMP